jgi:hypothetical protein
LEQWAAAWGEAVAELELRPLGKLKAELPL